MLYLARLTLEQYPHPPLLLEQGYDPPVGSCECQPRQAQHPGGASMRSTPMLLALLAGGLLVAPVHKLEAAQPGAPDPDLAQQLARGEDVYFADCAECHNDDLSGGAAHSAPALAGSGFLARWSGRNARELFELTRTTMPEGQPRTLSDADYLAVIAFVLRSNRIEMGEGPLSVDRIAQIGMKVP